MFYLSRAGEIGGFYGSWDQIKKKRVEFQLNFSPDILLVAVFKNAKKIQKLVFSLRSTIHAHKAKKRRMGR